MLQVAREETQKEFREAQNKEGGMWTCLPTGGDDEVTAKPVGSDPLIAPFSNTEILSRMAYLFAVPAKSGMPPYGCRDEDSEKMLYPSLRTGMISRCAG